MNKKILFILILFFVVLGATQALATLTFTSNAITGTTASTIDLGSGNALSLQTTGDGAITTGSGLFTAGGSLSVTGNVGIGDGTPDGLLDVEPNGAVTAASYGINLSNLTTNATTDGINKYGTYITSTGVWTGSTGTITKNYGLYVDTVSGADNNYSAYFANNVGIGTATPGALLDVQGSVNLEKGTGSVSTNAVTISKTSGVITDSTDINLDTTRAAITLTNTRIASASVVAASICSTPDAGARLGVAVTPGNGSATITVYNSGTANQTSDYTICFIVTN